MICSKEKCTGCFACYNICPKKAIIMEQDEYGEVFPKIDKEKCINCNLCKKVCPQLEKKQDLFPPLKAFAMYSIDPHKRNESTSGGAATMFYEQILSENGIIYGASNLFGMDEFKFIRIDNVNDLYKVKGSKYVHCYINNIYTKVKEDLINKKNVLFIGTPCQVAGLKSYLLKNYDNLITVDIICHGVPSQKLLFDEMKNQKIDPKDAYYIYFRDEEGFNFKILDKDKKQLINLKSENVYYYKNFLQGNIYRENCYSCQYAQINRVSDITIGDFWGLKKSAKIYDDEKKEISLVLPNTEKGLKLINKISNKCNSEERTIEEAKKHNGQLNHPVIKSKKFEIYRNNYTKLGYKKTMNKMTSTKDKIKKHIKNNALLYKLVKIIKQK